MRVYDLVQDFQGANKSDDVVIDQVSVSPEWVIAVIRLQYPVTYQRTQKGSFSTLFPDAVKVRGKTLIITSDAIQVQTSQTKGNHLTQMSATLLPGEVNYLSEILPGDYVLVWMLQEQERAADIVSRIRDGRACNKFMDGLKFMGRVQSLTKNLTQDPGGARTVRYSLSSVGFSEFDATFYYNQYLAENVTSISRWMGRVTRSFNQLIANGQIDVNKAIPFFVDLLFGRGIPSNMGRGNPDPALKSTAGLEGEYSYILPQEVGALIGKTVSSKSGGCLAVADTLELQTGVQTYDRNRTLSDYEVSVIDENNPDTYSNDKAKAVIFTPDGAASGSRRDTGTDMMGRFLPQRPQLENQSVWSILNHYLNPAANEMFTALRTNGDGRIVPTLTVRQLPFSSTLVNVPFPVTRFLDLPRWKAHPILVRAASVGRSDALRFNFVQVLGVAPLPSGKSSLTPQTVRNPPFRDDLDIARSGLRNYSTTIQCAIEDVKQKVGTGESTAASAWMNLLSDILMGQHMTLTGSVTMVGIQAPICIGDNLEWDGVVFHIEAVTHAGQISSDGKKTWSTTVSVTHGVRSNPGTSDDIGIYAGIKTQDQMSFNPPLTDEDRGDLGNSESEPAGAEDILAKRRAAGDKLTDPDQAPLSQSEINDLFGGSR